MPALEPPQILLIDGPDQVEEGTEIQLRWVLGGGVAAAVTLDGKKVAGTSCKVKPVTDPTVYTLAVSNRAGTVVAEKWVGTNPAGACVSSFLEVADAANARITNNNNPYRADSNDPAELGRVRKNLGLLGSGLFKITGMPNSHDPAKLNSRLKAIKSGHTPEDTLKLINAEHDRERVKIMWGHLGVLSHGGELQENHAYRIGNTDPDELARVRKSIGALSAGFAKIPGFAGANLAELDQKLKEIKPGGKPEETLNKINAEFDKVRGALFDTKPKPSASDKGKKHPYRAGNLQHPELDRVLKNLAHMSAQFHKLTKAGDKHDAAKLHKLVKGMKPKHSHAHTLDMINHHFDQERTKIVSRHAAHLHQGGGPGAPQLKVGHPYRVSTIDPSELARVRKNIATLAGHLDKVPGFGGRFDAAEHDRRIKSVKPGATDDDTVDRINTELDWERMNMLQLHPKPQPRPAMLPAAPRAPVHAYRADSIHPRELDRVRKNIAVLGAGLSKITGVKNAHKADKLTSRLRAIKHGHSQADRLKLINAEFDRERLAAMWPHLGALTHGGEVQKGHAFRVEHPEQAEISRVRKNIGELSAGFAKIPGFHAANLAELDRKLKGIKPGPKPAEATAKINAEFDRVRGELFNKPSKPVKGQKHPYRAESIEHAELDRVLKNLAIMSAEYHKLTGAGDKHEAAKLHAMVKSIKPKASKAHTLEMINHEFDHERTKIVSRHAGYLHHGQHAHHAHAHHAEHGKAEHGKEHGHHPGHPPEKPHPYRASSAHPAEVARVRRNIVHLGAGLAKIPGFGGRFNAAEHDRRMKSLKPGATAAETLARINAELDWERANMMQLHPKPSPRPPLLPAHGAHHAHKPGHPQHPHKPGHAEKPGHHGHAEKPGHAHAEKPGHGHAEKPGDAHAEKSDHAHADKPAPPHANKPAPPHANKPAPPHANKPAPPHASKPAPPK